jgi:long-chain fatty acid transport protein
MMTRARRSAVCLALSAAMMLALHPSTVTASGFAIFEQGARGMGFAGAFTAQASDPSAIFHNAAGIAFLKGKQIHLGATLIAPKSDFTGADPFPGSTVTEKGNPGVIVPPVFDYTQQLSERLVVGVGLHVPFGLKTQWDNPSSFSGRFLSKRAELKGFSLNPTLAYKLADRLAVGGGVDVRFTSLALDRDVATINPFTLRAIDVAAVELKSDTKVGVGFNLGLLAKPSDAFSIGVSYRHKVKTDYTGNATFTRLDSGNSQLDVLVARSIPTGAIAVTTSIEFPAILSGGIAYSPGSWTFEGDVDWYQWSTFKELPITFPDRPDLSGVVTENYENSMQYRFGLERRIGESWAVRGGYYYDKTPTPAESVGPLLPDADRQAACVGFSWKRGALRIDVAGWHLFFKERSTEGLNRDRYDGTYKNSADLFAVSLGFGF